MDEKMTGCINLKIKIEDIDTKNSLTSTLEVFNEDPVEVRRNILRAVDSMIKQMGYIPEAEKLWDQIKKENEDGRRDKKE